jgi:hypothetical protein
MKNAELMIIRQVAVVFKFLHDTGNVDDLVVENMNCICLFIESRQRSLVAGNLQNVLHFHKQSVGFFHSRPDAPGNFVNSINHFYFLS